MEAIHIVFGDVHGEATKLAALFDLAAQTYPGVPIVWHTVGDLIDRGSQSPEVLDLCVQHGVTGVLGNHETWLTYALTPNGQIEDDVFSRIMGGASTLRSYGVDLSQKPSQRANAIKEAVTPDQKRFLSSLKMADAFFAGGKTWLLVHAGINQSLVDAAIPTGMREDNLVINTLVARYSPHLLWSSPNLDAIYAFDTCVQVFGHKPLSSAVQTNHFVALDTGCGTCPPYRLSALVIHPDGRTNTLSV